MDRAPAISSVLELPFVRQAPLEALGFETDRHELNVEHTGYGWCRPAQLWLHTSTGAPPPPVGGEASAGDGLVCLEAPLVLALHAADDGPELAGDVVLEFALPGAAPVAAPLSLFLEKWLPRLLAELGAAGADGTEGAADGAAGEPAIVLAMCNPHRVALPRPAAARGHRLLYGLGDVDSWFDEPEDEAGGAGRLRLVASEWRAAK